MRGENAGGAVGALEKGADAREVSRLIAQHGADRDPTREMRAFLDPFDEFPDVGARRAACGPRAGVEPGRVQSFPELRSQGAAHGAGILAGALQAAENTAAVIAIQTHELEHGLGCNSLV